MFDQGRARALMENAGIGAVVTSHPPNISYLTGFDSPLLKQRHLVALAVLAIDSSPRLILPVVEIPRALELGMDPSALFPFGSFFVYELPGTGDAELYRKFTTVAGGASSSIADAIRSALPTVAHGAERVALDDLGLTGAARAAVTKALETSGYEVTSGSGLLERIRMVKTQLEAEKLDRAVVITESAMDTVLSIAKPGTTERDMRHIFRESVQSQGAEFGHWSSTSGDRSWALVDPSDRRLRPHDLIRLDGGCVFDGYWADVGYTVGVDGAPQEAVRRYECLRAGFDAAARTARPGIFVSEVFDAAVEAVRDAGIADYKRHDIGHGIGKEAYELPILRPANRKSVLFADDGDDFEIEASMALNIEIPHYVHGLGGFQLEKTFLVTEETTRPFGAATTALKLI